jgi:hypothetical protein
MPKHTWVVALVLLAVFAPVPCATADQITFPVTHPVPLGPPPSLPPASLLSSPVLAQTWHS